MNKYQITKTKLTTLKDITIDICYKDLIEDFELEEYERKIKRLIENLFCKSNKDYTSFLYNGHFYIKAVGSIWIHRISTFEYQVNKLNNKVLVYIIFFCHKYYTKMKIDIC